MKSFTMDSLLTLKKAVDEGKLSQTVEVQKVNSFVVEDYSERRKKYLDIKSYFENRVHGVTFEVSGGGTNHTKDKINPLFIKAYKHNERQDYNVVEIDGVFLYEHPSTVYDEYLNVLIKNSSNIENHHVCNWELIMDDALMDTYLCEDGFRVSDNSLLQFKEEKVYTIIPDIENFVQGLLVLNLPDELDESIIIVCIDKVIMLSEGSYYIDDSEKVVA